MEPTLTSSLLASVDWTGVSQLVDGGVGPYTLRFPLGRGGHADVWRATHRGTGRDLALRFETGPDAATHYDELRRHAQQMVTVQHPAIVRYLDLGVAGNAAERISGGRVSANAPYLGMEPLLGGPLRDALPSADAATIVRWLTTLLDGLTELHARDLVHLDVRLENVLFRTHQRQEPVWIDFGRDAHDPDPRYAAPEELRHRELGPATDAYRFALLAHEVLTGEVPFADSPRRRLFGGWDDTALRATLPDAEPLCRFFARALDPKTRFSDACAALRAWPFEAEVATPAPPLLLPTLLVRHRLRHPPFFGYSRERAYIDQKLRALRDGTRGAFAIRGPSGSGKTALLRHTAVRATRQCLPVQSLEGSADTAMLAVAEATTPTVFLLDDAPPSLVRELALSLKSLPIPCLLLAATNTEALPGVALSGLGVEAQDALRLWLGAQALPAMSGRPGELIDAIEAGIRTGTLTIEGSKLTAQPPAPIRFVEVTSAERYARRIAAAMTLWAPHFDAAAWTKAANLSSFEAGTLLDHWTLRGWLRADGSGQRTVKDDTPFRDAFAEASDEEKRAIHAFCAEALAEARGFGRTRYAQHLVASGEPRSVAPVLRGARAALRAMDPWSALALLDPLNDLPDDEAVSADLLRSRAHRAVGDLAASEQTLRNARRRARAGAVDLQVRCDILSGQDALERGLATDGLRFAIRAHGRARHLPRPDLLLEATTLYVDAVVYAAVRPPRDLLQPLQNAARAPQLIAETHLLRARLALAENDDELALTALNDANAAWPRSRPHPGLLEARGRLHARGKRWPEAEAALTEAAEGFLRLTRASSIDIELRLGSVRLAQARPERAWNDFLQACDAMDLRGRPVASAAIAFCAHDALDQDWDAFDERVSALEATGIRPLTAVRGALAWTHKTLQRRGESERAARLARLGEAESPAPFRW
ncbi:MAG: protein kinase [Myxococcota bacterium]